MDIESSRQIKFLNEMRAKRLTITVSVLLFILVFRLWQLQIFQGQKFRSFSDQNTIKEQKVKAPRGYFLDRNGQTLVGNRPGYRLSIDPKLFRFSKTTRLKEIFKEISPILNREADELFKNSKRSYSKLGSYIPTLVAKEITNEQALQLKRLRHSLPELNVDEVIFRDYPLKESGAQIFGYVSTANEKQILKLRRKGNQIDLGDQIGQTGLEQSLDKFVRGTNGLSYVQIDAKGRLQNSNSGLISYVGLKDIDAKIGNNVVLTIDKELQQEAYNAFFRKDKIGIRKGGLVALNIEGEVLAWASNPSYDPSEFQTGISHNLWNKLNKDPYKPLTDKVAQGTYSPGSVFKPLVGLAALYHEVITPFTLLDSPSGLYFGGRVYHDHSQRGHGKINLATALEVSGNVFFYKLGIEMGVDKMSEVISRVGIGKRTGIRFISESKGLLPTSKWKEDNRSTPWQKGEDLSYAIGQGFINTTLLQLARSYLTIATKGLVYKPLLVKEVFNEKGRSIASYDSELIEDLKKTIKISEKDFEAVIYGLTKVAHGDRGTARYRSSKKFKMAGKTGTVQLRNFSSEEIYKSCEDRKEENRHHGFFVGFAPAENPEVVVAGLALHSCHGSSGAAPMVTDLLTAYMKKKHPEIFNQ